MKKIVKVSCMTVAITLFAMSIIFFMAGNHRCNRAMKLYEQVTESNLKTDKRLDETASVIKQIEDREKIRPHTVVLLKPNEFGLWDVEDIKQFEQGQQKEFIDFLRGKQNLPE
jgi:hypothetical protein